MENLSIKMKERLEKWRKNTLPVPATAKVKGETSFRRPGKGDFGDAFTEEEWDNEARRSQTRR